jgi:hypothetical protein
MLSGRGASRQTASRRAGTRPRPAWPWRGRRSSVRGRRSPVAAGSGRTGEGSAIECGGRPAIRAARRRPPAPRGGTACIRRRPGRPDMEELLLVLDEDLLAAVQAMIDAIAGLLA